MPISRLVSITMSVLTFAISWLVWHGFAMWVESPHPIYLPTVILGSLVVHELFHFAVFEYHGIRAHIVFLVIVGGSFPDLVEENLDKFKSLHSSQKSALFLVGVVGHIVAVAVATALYTFDVLSIEQLNQAVLINGLLMLVNLIPIGSFFDGGRFVSLLFESSPEKERWKYVAVIGSAFMFLFALDWYFTGSPDLRVFAMSGILILVLWLDARWTEPERATDPHAMNRFQRRLWTVAYLALIGAGTVLIAVSASLRVL